jgi:hypothetical protein
MPIHDPCALLGRIAPADPDQGWRNARHVPYWAA